MRDRFAGEQLKSLREKSGRSIEEICAYITKSKAAYYRYETGEIKPKNNIIIRLCEILRCQPNELYGFDNDPSPWSNYAVAAAKLVEALKSNQEKDVALHMLSALKVQEIVRETARNLTPVPKVDVAELLGQ